MAVVPAPGFSPLTISDITSNGSDLNSDFKNAITNVIVTRTMNSASTLIIQLTDPHRSILTQPGLLGQGSLIEIPDGFGNYLQFAFRKLSKASDQLEFTFESRVINDLRTTINIVGTSDITDVGTFVKNICDSKGIPFVGPVNDPYIQPTLFAGSSGTSTYPNEDAWASMFRIASALGWRCWESAGTIFFGPDEYWYNPLYEFANPPVNSYYQHGVPDLAEFTENIQLMDTDWDVGSAFGDMTITCMSHFWEYNPGEVINITGMGPANGGWLVSGMQRDFVDPVGTITATMPMPAYLTLNPPLLPIVGGRVF